ncbi:MAG: AraC family transcriptional regulator ligand-binding domain-containing protein [Rhodocyclaceae bacterium]
MHQHGYDPQMACHGLGVTLEDIETAHFRLSHFEACLIVRRALRILGDHNPGLALGQHANLGSRGILALGCMTSATLGDALNLAMAHPSEAGHLLDVSAHHAGHCMTTTLGPMFGNFDLLPFLSEKMFAGMVRLMRLVTERRCAPISVEFAHGTAQEIGRYEDFFGCRVRFGGSGYRLVMNMAWLETPLPSRCAASHQLACEILLREQQKSAPTHSLEHAILRIFRRALANPPVVEEVARMLHMSERTLRRRLSEAGLSFQGLLDECRASFVLEHLPPRQESLTALAAQLGFTDLHSFRRAFQRWTGTKLSTYWRREFGEAPAHKKKTGR